MSKKDAALIYARAVLVTDSGKELLKQKSITTKNIGQLKVTGKTVLNAAGALSELGFTVENDAGQSGSIGISGTAKLFEKTFGAKLSATKKGDNKYVQFVEPATIPAVLKPWVDAIVFAEPAEYFY
ncbi:MAG: hypothetical protein JNM68_04635 [Dinghuibacter sp.]|nr:hypothetical protein [Dinghuibacter sp.]